MGNLDFLCISASPNDLRLLAFQLKAPSPASILIAEQEEIFDRVFDAMPYEDKWRAYYNRASLTMAIKSSMTNSWNYSRATVCLPPFYPPTAFVPLHTTNLRTLKGNFPIPFPAQSPRTSRNRNSSTEPQFHKTTEDEGEVKETIPKSTRTKRRKVAGHFQAGLQKEKTQSPHTSRNRNSSTEPQFHKTTEDEGEVKETIPKSTRTKRRKVAGHFQAGLQKEKTQSPHTSRNRNSSTEPQFHKTTEDEGEVKETIPKSTRTKRRKVAGHFQAGLEKEKTQSSDSDRPSSKTIYSKAISTSLHMHPGDSTCCFCLSLRSKKRLGSGILYNETLAAKERKAFIQRITSDSFDNASRR